MSDDKKSYDGAVVRSAKKEDMAAVAGLIQELADFEKMSDGPKLTVKDLERDGFDLVPPLFKCKVAETSEGSIVGYAIYFPSYSTWRGRALMLEDLYVQPEGRRQGVGRKLFDAVVKEAHSTGCCRMDFHVLEWNPATSFYLKLGAENLTASEQWGYFRLDRDGIEMRVKAME